MNHIRAKCMDDDCGGTCNYCCLFICEVCGGAEASLPTDCPGRRLTNEESEGIEAGKLDYLSESWVQYPAVQPWWMPT